MLSQPEDHRNAKQFLLPTNKTLQVCRFPKNLGTKSLARTILRHVGSSVHLQLVASLSRPPLVAYPWAKKKEPFYTWTEKL